VDWDWTRVVIDHVQISVRDLEASIAFYKTVLEPLGIPPLWESDRGAQLANLVVVAREPASGPVHIAFVAGSREQVDAFHRAGVEAGYEDNGAPGVREQYSSDEAGRYYAAFLLDLDQSSVLVIPTPTDARFSGADDSVAVWDLQPCWHPLKCARGSSERWFFGRGLSPFGWREVGDEPAQIDPVRDLPVQLRHEVGVEEDVEVDDDRDVRFGDEFCVACA